MLTGWIRQTPFWMNLRAMGAEPIGGWCEPARRDLPNVLTPVGTWQAVLHARKDSLGLTSSCSEQLHGHPVLFEPLRWSLALPFS